MEPLLNEIPGGLTDVEAFIIAVLVVGLTAVAWGSIIDGIKSLIRRKKWPNQ